MDLVGSTSLDELRAATAPMLHLFEKAGFDIERRSKGGVYELKMMFRSG